MIVSVNRKHNKQYFYKYTTAETAKIILVNKNLRFSSPLILNDPFDVTRKLKFSFSSKQLNRAIFKEIAYLVETGASPQITSKREIQAVLLYAATLNTEQKKDFLAQLQKPKNLRNLKKLPNLDFLQSFKEIEEKWQSNLPKLRILSLAEEHDNTVMWSHYTNNYKGVVLELECLDLYDSVLLLAEPVCYSDEFPTLGGDLLYWVKLITGQIEFDYKVVFSKLYLIKMTNWAREKEWRVISFEKDSNELYSDYGMHPRTYSKIFFGKDISCEHKSDLLQLITFELSHMEAYQMIEDHNERKLSFSRLK